MSGNLNRVMILGNLGKDPEIRSTHDGREVANLVIATAESWTDKNSGERKERTEWHKIACFNPGITNVIRNHLKKGSKVFIEGQLQTRKWQDQSGADRFSTEIVMQGFNCNLIMLDKRQDEDKYAKSDFSQAAKDYEAKSKGFQPQNDLDDDIPF